MDEYKSPDTRHQDEGADASMARLGGERRRLLKGALAAAPVVAAMRSRNVLATTNVRNMQTVSAFLSAGATSSSPDVTPASGLTPGYWGNHPESWPSPYSPGTLNNAPHDFNNDGTLMNAVWSVGCNNNYNNVSMMRVLWAGGGGDPFQVGGHLVSALLNLQSNKVSSSILSLATIQAMGNAVLCGNLYEAAPGVFWDAAQVVAYLQQTMT